MNHAPREYPTIDNVDVRAESFTSVWLKLAIASHVQNGCGVRNRLPVPAYRQCITPCVAKSLSQCRDVSALFFNWTPSTVFNLSAMLNALLPLSIK
eukprot:scaffold31529_cov23-Cyclotella_meneghiniana.AAC.1